VAKPKVRTGMPGVQLKKGEFFERARARFYDPTFAAVAPEIEKIIEVAWKNYTEYRKSPRTHRAGRGFGDPEFALPMEWLETRSVIDWMAEIYPRWVAAHGIMILCPVNWYQAPSSLKLMIDRPVCADGGNPDPTLTGGKNPERAKEVELKGWHYPRHLAGRLFSVVVHGDAAARKRSGKFSRTG
jgi:hypothetical protein